MEEVSKRNQEFDTRIKKEPEKWSNSIENRKAYETELANHKKAMNELIGTYKFANTKMKEEALKVTDLSYQNMSDENDISITLAEKAKTETRLARHDALEQQFITSDVANFTEENINENFGNFLERGRKFDKEEEVAIEYVDSTLNNLYDAQNKRFAELVAKPAETIEEMEGLEYEINKFNSEYREQMEENMQLLFDSKHFKELPKEQRDNIISLEKAKLENKLTIHENKYKNFYKNEIKAKKESIKQRELEIENARLKEENSIYEEFKDERFELNEMAEAEDFEGIVSFHKGDVASDRDIMNNPSLYSDYKTLNQVVNKNVFIPVYTKEFAQNSKEINSKMMDENYTYGNVYTEYISPKLKGKTEAERKNILMSASSAGLIPYSIAVDHELMESQVYTTTKAGQYTPKHGRAKQRLDIKNGIAKNLRIGRINKPMDLNLNINTMSTQINRVPLDVRELFLSPTSKANTIDAFNGMIAKGVLNSDFQGSPEDKNARYNALFLEVMTTTNEKSEYFKIKQEILLSSKYNEKTFSRIGVSKKKVNESVISKQVKELNLRR